MKEYKPSWNEEVTTCCQAAPEYGGGYPDYYKKCPLCGAGSFYWPVNTEMIYHPSSHERELEDRIEALELELKRQTTRLL